jgi:iron complex outermembrane recepter protein
MKRLMESILLFRQSYMPIMSFPRRQESRKFARIMFQTFCLTAMASPSLITGAVVFYLFSPLSGFAAEPVTVLEEVVVTATRHEEKLTSVPANVTILTEKDIRISSATNVPEFLRTQSGIQVNDISGNRRTYTVDLRGFGETAPLNSLVLVDGRRVTQADLSGADWAQVPLERIERIEIIRGGGGSVLYGDNAAGGVINIITKEGRAYKAGADISAGSYGAIRTNAYVGGSNHNFSYLLSGNYNKSDGYRQNSKTEGSDAGINVSYFPLDRLKLNLSSGYHRDNTGLPGALKESDFAAGKIRTDSIYPNDFAETKDYYIKGSPEIYLGDESLLRMDLSYRQRDFSSFASGSWGNFTGRTKLETVDISPHAVLKSTTGAIKNSLTAGFDFHDAKEGITNDSNFFGSSTSKDYRLKKEGIGYYIHDELTILKNLVFSGGYRYDRARFSYEPGTPESTSVNEKAYTAGLNYIFTGKSYLYASYTKGFRYPVLDEFFSFFTNTVDSSLTPQQSDDYEFGLRHYFADDFFVHLNFFRVDTEKEIYYNLSNYRNENLDGLTRRQGMELSFNAKATAWLFLQGSYTYLHAKIEEGQFAGKDIPGAAKNKATLGASFFPATGLSLSVNGVYVGGRPFISDLDNAFGNQEDYYLINSRIEYRREHMKAFLVINNLLNKDYAEYGALGLSPTYSLEKGYYPSPERNFLAGVSIDL